MTGTMENSIWIPGQRLDHLYPEVTQQDLQDEFSEILDAPTMPVGDVLGTLRTPGEHEMIHGVASIDLCDILRETAASMVRTAGNLDYKSNAYVDGFWEDFESQDDDYKSSVVQSTVQVLMDSRGVTPTDGHEEMAAIMRNWRSNGIFVVANTSTLPGCELSTLHFLNEYYGQCIDGIVFPRNHDGRGKITKSHALKMAIAEISKGRPEPQFAFHIDDTTHHAEAMIHTPPHHNTHLFMPRFESNKHLEGHEKIVHADTPVEVFGHADDYVREQLDKIGHPHPYSDRARHLVAAALARTMFIPRNYL